MVDKYMIMTECSSIISCDCSQEGKGVGIYSLLQVEKRKHSSADVTQYTVGATIIRTARVFPCKQVMQD